MDFFRHRAWPIGPRGSFKTCLGPAVLLPKVGGGRRIPLGRFENMPRLQGAPSTRGSGDPPADGGSTVTWQSILPRKWRNEDGVPF